MKKILFFLLVAGFNLMSAFAQPLGWSHAKFIAVTENSGTNVYNYQLKIIFDSQSLIAAGEMNFDCSDLRFGSVCDAANLNYWIESGINTPNTVVWVKIDTLLASQTSNILMFYGNPIATSLSAVNGTFFGPMSSTDSVSSGAAGGVGNSQRGFRFSPNQDILVTDFGKREPNGTARYVTLFDFATQAIIAQNQVSGPAAQYSYGSLMSPIWLTQGTQYVLELYQGASDGYYFGTSSQIGQHLTYLDMRYCNSCTQNTFPTNTLTNYHYGTPDLWYYIKTNVTPAPSYAIGISPSLSIGPDTAVCGSFLLDAGNGASAYLWSNGDTTQTSLATISAAYNVMVTTAENCLVYDTVNVIINSFPLVDLGPDSTFCSFGLLDAGVGTNTYLWNTTDTTQTIVAAAPGMYNVSVTSMQNCTSYDTINVLINPLPTVYLGLDTSFCVNGSLTAAGNGVSFLWNTSDTTQTISISSSATYIVEVTSLDNCFNSDTIDVIVNPLPTVLFILSADTVCASYAPVSLSTGTPVGGAYTGTGVAAGSFDPAIGVGSYSILYAYTDANGCTNSDTDNMVVLGCAGIDAETEISISIFPNPNNGNFYVEHVNLDANSTINIYDILGKKVYGNALQESVHQVNMSVSSGTYIVEIISKDLVVRKRIIIN